MKNTILILALFASTSVMAGPHVDSSAVAFAQPKAGWAEITYVLQDAPAVITLDIQTNDIERGWITIGADKVRTLKGDVNKIVKPSDEPRTISWKCSADWPGLVIRDGSIRAIVEVWPLNEPPPWLVIDLETREIACYRDEAAMPYALTNEIYKTRCLVMRKIPAAHVTWRMGTPDTLIDSGWKSSDGKPQTGYYERLHTVTFTEDYYLAVYPLVQSQNTILQEKAGMDKKTMTLNLGGANISPLKPASGLSYAKLRGSPADYNWPQDGHAVSPDSYLGKMRAYIGQGLEFDFPTEAQWEFACRAGETNNWNTGTTDWHTCCYSAASSLGEVGYSRNAWGIYDMHGNAGAFCLERITSTYKLGLSHVNPPGELSPTDARRVCRGGWFSLAEEQVPIYCRSGARYRYDVAANGNAWALRVAAPARLSAE